MATFHQISSQNLECPICLTLFNQPKLLACSHTFCKDCLQRIFQTQPDQQTLTCPVCRNGTPLPSGDASKLQTNVPLSSLVDEVQTKNPTCTVCEMDEKPPAVSYCQDCGKYMCDSCEKSHSTWNPFSTHSIEAMSEVLSGKVPLKRRRKCKKHPNDDEECFCTGCREYICCKCGMLEHLQEGHKLEEAAIHEEKLMKNIKELKERNELEAMEEESRRTIRQMNAMEDLVTNGMKVPLEKDALFVHDTLSEKLKSFLGRDDPDHKSPRAVTERAQKISFSKHVKVNELFLGELKGMKWDVIADVELPCKDSMNCVTRAPDGKMAVGSSKDGMHFYSADGKLQQTVLKDVGIRHFGFLSDGRSVVRDANYIMSLYTPQWEKLDVTFETASFDQGGYGDLTVDEDDNIYVSYRNLKKIQVFAPNGGKAVRDVMCDGLTPVQIFSFRTMGKLLLRHSSAVVCLYCKGKKNVLHVKKRMLAYPAICRDDSVIVAWVKYEEGLVSIDQYTTDLEHVHNIVSDFKIQKSEGRNWYYLQEFDSGEIAFCTTDRLYLFDAILHV
ncbi:uncharacterized protein [Diadema antillarum]|uniref:uncharacterized protein n=1 Tax=Diadema antillarum TaxID=105358 RepID=UPI003A86902F